MTGSRRSPSRAPSAFAKRLPVVLSSVSRFPSDPVLRSVVGSVARSVLAAVREAAAVVLPVSCAGCGRPDVGVCRECRAMCDVPVRRADVGGVPTWYTLDYSGPSARLVFAFKNGGRTGLAGVLGPAFGRAVDEAVAWAESSEGTHAVIVVPVPGRRAALRRRGYQPICVLARASGVRLSRGVRFARQPRDQLPLGALERRRNLHGALRGDRALSGASVVIVDDVATSGATISEAERAVRAAGGRVVCAAVLAQTPDGRRTRSPSSVV